MSVGSLGVEELNTNNSNIKQNKLKRNWNMENQSIKQKIGNKRTEHKNWHFDCHQFIFLFDHKNRLKKIFS